MSFFSRAATTALTGLAILGFASSAFAHHVEQQPWDEEQMGQLARAALDVGISLHQDVGICNEMEGLMGAMFEKGHLLVCTEAHKDEDGMIRADELADTVRHELLHAVQYCLGREMIHPQHEDQFIEDARDQLHMPMMGYDPEEWGGEAEARVLSYLLSEEEIAPMLRQACANHVWPKDIEAEV